MTGEQIRELIQRDVDGDLSPSERRSLDSALRRNAGARRLHAELKSLGTSLASVRQAEPPANLENKIRAGIRSRMVPPPSRRSWIESLRALVRTPTVLRYGTVFAGGLVTGALLFMFLIHPQPSAGVSADAATGTLITNAESYPLDLQGARGTLNAIQTETGKELTLRLICAAPTTAKLTFDPSRVKLENIRDVQSAGGALVNDGVVSVTGTGPQKFTLSFTGVRDSRVTVQVTCTGGGSFTRDIQVR